MRKLKIVSFLSVFLLILIFIGLTVNAGQKGKDVTVNISSLFEDDEITHDGLPATYGTGVSFDQNLELPAGESFAFWLHNGTVKKVLLDHGFIVTEKPS